MRSDDSLYDHDIYSDASRSDLEFYDEHKWVFPIQVAVVQQVKKQRIPIHMRTPVRTKHTIAGTSNISEGINAARMGSKQERKQGGSVPSSLESTPTKTPTNRTPVKRIPERKVQSSTVTVNESPKESKNSRKIPNQDANSGKSYKTSHNTNPSIEGQFLKLRKTKTNDKTSPKMSNRKSYEPACAAIKDMVQLNKSGANHANGSNKTRHKEVVNCEAKIQASKLRKSASFQQPTSQSSNHHRLSKTTDLEKAFSKVRAKADDKTKLECLSEKLDAMLEIREQKKKDREEKLELQRKQQIARLQAEEEEFLRNLEDRRRKREALEGRLNEASKPVEPVVPDYIKRANERADKLLVKYAENVGELEPELRPANTSANSARARSKSPQKSTLQTSKNKTIQENRSRQSDRSDRNLIKPSQQTIKYPSPNRYASPTRSSQYKQSKRVHHTSSTSTSSRDFDSCNSSSYRESSPDKFYQGGYTCSSDSNSSSYNNKSSKLSRSKSYERPTISSNNKVVNRDRKSSKLDDTDEQHQDKMAHNDSSERKDLPMSQTSISLSTNSTIGKDATTTNASTISDFSIDTGIDDFYGTRILVIKKENTCSDATPLSANSSSDPQSDSSLSSGSKSLPKSPYLFWME